MERLLVEFLLVLGVVGVHPGMRQYELVSEEKNWTDAQIYCRERYTDLAIDDMEDMDRINQNINSSDCVWIGLYSDKQNKTVFKWSDDSNSSFRSWGKNEPSAIMGCVETVGHFGWDNWPCDHLHPFLCYKNAVLITPTAETYSQRIVFRVTTDVLPDVENHEIMEEILKQIHESLKTQGIAEEEISLTWLKQPGGCFVPEKQYRPPKKNTCVGVNVSLCPDVGRHTCTDEEKDTE